MAEATDRKVKAAESSLKRASLKHMLLNAGIGVSESDMDSLTKLFKSGEYAEQKNSGGLYAVEISWKPRAETGRPYSNVKLSLNSRVSADTLHASLHVETFNEIGMETHNFSGKVDGLSTGLCEGSETPWIALENSEGGSMITLTEGAREIAVTSGVASYCYNQEGLN